MGDAVSLMVSPTDFHVKSWNSYQEKFFRAIDEHGLDARYVISYRPGAGKTIAALAWLKAQFARGVRGAIYVAPFRALCMQVLDVMRNVENWPVDPLCVLGGDDQDAPVMDILQGREQKVLICTPEVVVSNLGKWSDSSGGIPIVLDEVHMRHDASRGWLYDILLRYFSANPMVAMSGTLGKRSIHAIVSYGKRIQSSLPAYEVSASESSGILANLVPIPFHGRNPSESKVASMLISLAESKGQVLCFVASKAYGRRLLQSVRCADPIKSSRFHNADLSPNERVYIEEEFAEGRVDILIHTTTLVTGIDFDVTAGVIAQVRTSVGDVEIYDIIQAASRVGRRRSGVVYIMIPQSWDTDSYLSRISSFDCGYPPSPDDVDPWVGARWVAWSQELGLGDVVAGNDLLSYVSEARRILGPVFRSALVVGLSPLTAVQVRRALLFLSRKVGGSWGELPTEAKAALLADELYRVSEVRAQVLFPASSIPAALVPHSNYGDRSGRWRAVIAHALYTKLSRGILDPSHVGVILSIVSILGMVASIDPADKLLSLILSDLGGGM